MKYHFKIHKEGSGFWAECIELDGCFTQGDSKEELYDNMQDALDTYLTEPETSKISPLPSNNIAKSRTIVEVSPSPNVAMGVTIKRARLLRKLTQKEAAKKLGMKSLYSYQRLEKRCNPTLDLIVKILSLFPNISLDKILKV